MSFSKRPRLEEEEFDYYTDTSNLIEIKEEYCEMDESYILDDCQMTLGESLSIDESEPLPHEMNVNSNAFPVIKQEQDCEKVQSAVSILGMKPGKVPERSSKRRLRSTQTIAEDPLKINFCYDETSDGNLVCTVDNCQTQFNANMFIDMIDHYCTVHKPSCKFFVCPVRTKLKVECGHFNSVFDLFNHVCKIHMQLLSFPELWAASKLMDKPFSPLCDKMVDYHKKVDRELDKFPDNYFPAQGTFIFSDKCAGGNHHNPLYQCPISGCKVPPMKVLLDILMHYLTHGVEDLDQIKLFVCSWSPCVYKTKSYDNFMTHMYNRHSTKVDRLYISNRVDKKALQDPIAREMFRQYRKSTIDLPSKEEMCQSAKIICQITARAPPPHTSARRYNYEILLECPFPNCEISCIASLIKPTSIIGHINKFHLNIKPFQCSMCNYLNSDPESIVHHLKLRHGKKRSAIEIMLAVPAFAKAAKYLFELCLSQVKLQKNKGIKKEPAGSVLNKTKVIKREILA